jgi:hypothetical protein
MIPKNVSASNDNIDLPKNSKIRAITLAAGADAATLLVLQGAAQSGGVAIARLEAVAHTTAVISFPGEGLSVGDNYLSVTVSGTTPVAFLYVD